MTEHKLCDMQKSHLQIDIEIHNLQKYLLLQFQGGLAPFKADTFVTIKIKFTSLIGMLMQCTAWWHLTEYMYQSL